MSMEKDFYTLKGYQLKQLPKITSAMEDYLEMIYRLQKEFPAGQNTNQPLPPGSCAAAKSPGIVRIRELAAKLHVQPSSASKMVHNLADLEYVSFPKYGYILLTEKGLHTGAFLLHRHEVLHSFFCILNQSDHELEQVEKIEHFISSETLKNLETLTKLLSASELWPPRKN